MKGKKSVLFLMAAVFTVALIFPFLSGCTEGGDENEKKVDPDKIQLYLGNFNGGLGEEWLNQMILLFEADHPDVQVWIDGEKDLYSDTNLLDRIASNRQDLYFLPAMTLNNYIKGGKLADITDIVTTPLNEIDLIESEETVSIADKIRGDALKDYFETDDGKYYAVPFYEAFFGLNYDVDLFDAKLLYFNESGTGFITNKNQPRSAGPDGKKPSEDDGLPATMSQYRQLLAQMVTVGVTPMTWAGKHANYLERYLMSLWADYEGKDNFNLNNSFAGEYTFKGDTTPTEITEKNAYLLQKQGGKTHALEMAHAIASNSDYYSSNALGPSQTQLLAQDEFLSSVLTQKRVGMLVDAIWWENEADATFQEMASAKGQKYARGVRNFGFMPPPKADDGSGDPTRTFLSASGASVICVNAATTKLDLAKEFLLYCNTVEGMRLFTRITGMPKPYYYDMTEEDLSKMSYYGASIWNTYKDPDVQIVYNNVYTSKLRQNNPSYFAGWSFSSKIEGEVPYSNPILAFRENPNLTVETYQNGMLNMYSDWETRFGF